MSVAVGDVSDDATLLKLRRSFPSAAGLSAGFSCQPFSPLGDQRGRHDARSGSLAGVFKATFLLQAPWLMLPPLGTAGLDAATLGYRWTSVELELSHVWCSHRKRWCVITKTCMPEVVLRPWNPLRHTSALLVKCCRCLNKEARQWSKCS